MLNHVYFLSAGKTAMLWLGRVPDSQQYPGFFPTEDKQIQHAQGEDG
jgi:hypothetical protein